MERIMCLGIYLIGYVCLYCMVRLNNKIDTKKDEVRLLLFSLWSWAFVLLIVFAKIEDWLNSED